MLQLRSRGRKIASVDRLLDANDDDLALAAREDPNAFGILYERYVDRIYGYCLIRLRDRAAAEDASSDVFLKAFAGVNKYHGGNFAAWLFRIAHNAVISILQREQPHSTLEAGREPIDGEPTPEETVLKRAEREELIAGMARLGDEQRIVIELQLARWTGTQIAEATGKSSAAVKKLRYRAVSRLSAFLISADGTREFSNDR
jgi:RNA polymerase sigma-70 factor, ECF subfamily